MRESFRPIIIIVVTERERERERENLAMAEMGSEIGDEPIVIRRHLGVAVEHLWSRVKCNVGHKNNGWNELSGSLGDLGTFVPIVLALALVNKLDLGTTLLFTGAYNVITGI
jgi:hypothetical protein